MVFHLDVLHPTKKKKIEHGVRPPVSVRSTKEFVFLFLFLSFFLNQIFVCLFVGIGAFGSTAKVYFLFFSLKDKKIILICDFFCLCIFYFLFLFESIGILGKREKVKKEKRKKGKKVGKIGGDNFIKKMILLKKRKKKIKRGKKRKKDEKKKR
ncbi:hypothetical protein RFI_35871 [Reticulomyxa filosa]|uniref:Uncharacterized protein n=1 Tax=Reticulomyxa filosa TaxID=46433 RepID=X6LIX3_RETFI|nr:hypothetical protein RFI_35871 [Reticulomyxa filosa]|eukprot:ETO01569.1 hypothetical protein RFI_35871 [Reticulomyxa filosa]